MTRRIYIEDDQGVTALDLIEARTLVGRDASCDLILDHDRISRRHLELVVQDDQVLVRDLNSRNGTRLDDDDLHGEATFKPGQVVELGGVFLHLDREPAAARHTAERPSADENLGAPPATRRLAADRRRSSSSLPTVLAAAALIGVVAWMNWPDQPEANPTTERAQAKNTASGRQQSEKPDALVGDTEQDSEPVGLDAAEAQAIHRRALEMKSAELALKEHLLVEDWVAALHSIETFEANRGSQSGLLRRRLQEAENRSALEVEREFRRRALDNPAAARVYLNEHKRNYLKGSEAAERLSTLVAPTRSDLTPQPEVAEATPGGDVVPVPDGVVDSAKVSPSQETFFKAHSRAETFAMARRFEDAASAASEAVALARTQQVGREILRQLLRNERAYHHAARFEEILLTELDAYPEQFTGVPALPGERGDYRRRDGRVLVISVGEQERKLALEALSDAARAAFAKKVNPEPVDGITVAAILLGQGEEKSAHRLLQLAHRVGPQNVDSIEYVLSDHLGIERPDDGFVWHENRFITSRDLARIEGKAAVVRLLPKLQAGNEEVRLKAYEELHEIGAGAASAFQRTLIDLKSRHLDRMKSLGGYAELAALQKERQQLDDARDLALDLIFDVEKYPYPYNGRGAAVKSLHDETQAQIDRRVSRVKEVWESATEARVSKDLKSAISYLDEVDAQLTRLALGDGLESPSFIRHLPDHGVVNIKTFATDVEDRERIDWSTSAMTQNRDLPSKANSAEKRQVEVTNDYRVMMGRHAVRIHDKLLLCARMHSRDMSRGGFFSHTNHLDPKKRTPRDRAILVGYYGIGISENIAQAGGGPEGAHRGWTHSSGHHRNILSKRWRLLGSGNDGRNWTQNFSIREYNDDEQKRIRGIEGGDGTPEDGGHPGKEDR